MTAQHELRVLQIIDSAMVGGGQEHLYLLAAGLDRTRYRTVVTCAPDGPLVQRLGEIGIEVVPNAITKSISPGTLWRLARLMRAQRIDLVHTHGTLAGLYGRLAGLAAGAPAMVHTFHGIHYLNQAWPLRRAAMIRVDRLLARRTAAVICVSEADLESGARLGLLRPASASLIPNGIDVRPFLAPRDAAAVRRELTIPDGHRVVGAIARLHVQKGLAYLLRALARLERTDVILLLVGDGPRREELARLAGQLGIADRVRFLGARREVPAILAALDVFVLPSLWEGLPLTILEAGASGCPIVATDVPGTREAVQSGVSALLVPPRDAEALAAAIGRLLDDPEGARRMGALARARVLEHFRVERMVSATAAVYERVASERRLPRVRRPRIGIDVRKIDDLGIGTYIQNLLAGLARSRADADFILFADRSTGRGCIPAGPGFRVVEESAPKYSLRELVTLPIRMKRHRIDLFHSPHYVLPPIRPCPAVVTIHDLIHLRYPEFLPSGAAHIYARLMLGLAARSASMVFTVSEASKRDIVELLRVPPAKVVVIPNSVHPRFRPVPRDEARANLAVRLQVPQRFVLYAGSFSPHKNLPRLVRAFATLAPAHSGIQLVLAGETSGRANELADLAAGLGIGDRLVLPGRLAGAELPSLYSLAELFVFPSLYEGFGLPPLEAMACGTPAVVSDSSSLPEVVGDAALLVDPLEPESIAAGIVRLLDDPDLHREMTERGRARARAFLRQDAARPTLEVYHRVLAGEAGH